MVKRLKTLGNPRKSGDHPDYNIMKTGQNTDESPRDLRRLAVTETPVKDQKQMLRQACQEVTLIPIVINAFGTVTKGLLKGLEDLEVGGRVETIQTTALLRTARILRRVLET